MINFKLPFLNVESSHSKSRYSLLELYIMNYTSKLIIKESANDFNAAVKTYLESLPSTTKVISCDHSISFKTVATNNDALFSCMIVTGQVAA